jgi:hypothetical protein
MAAFDTIALPTVAAFDIIALPNVAPFPNWELFMLFAIIAAATAADIDCANLRQSTGTKVEGSIHALSSVQKQHDSVMNNYHWKALNLQDLQKKIDSIKKLSARASSTPMPSKEQLTTYSKVCDTLLDRYFANLEKKANRGQLKQLKNSLATLQKDYGNKLKLVKSNISIAEYNCNRREAILHDLESFQAVFDNSQVDLHYVLLPHWRHRVDLIKMKQMLDRIGLLESRYSKDLERLESVQELDIFSAICDRGFLEWFKTRSWKKKVQEYEQLLLKINRLKKDISHVYTERMQKAGPQADQLG